ncbi:hypothetical protein UlMin_021310 [Ulmus minor]
MGGPATGETNRARKNYARQSRTDPFPHQVNLTGHKEKIPRLSDDAIIFTESEARGLWHPHTDAIVVTLRIAGRKVFRILVDNRSSADILFKSTFNRMNLVGVKIEPTASSLSVPLFDDEPEKTCKIGSALTGKFKEDLVTFLREHRDDFAWSHEDMPGIDPDVIVHPSWMPIPGTIRFECTKKIKNIQRWKWKFIGFMVNHRGIEANPAKIQAFLDMEPPRKIKEVQRLTGRIAALNRFISRATDRCKPFFQALRKGKDFIWIADCEQSFQKLKSYIGQPPLLSKPHEGDSLILYLAVSKGAVSSALVREEDGVQWPIYYTSKSLLDAETRYPEIEKLALALMVAARKLRPYFQAHTIIVPTKFPLKQVFQKPKASGRLAKWSIELGEFDIQFKPRTAIKGQALADFIAEFTYTPEMSEKITTQTQNSQWKLYVDGSSTETTEYEALLSGLRLAKEVSAWHLTIYNDSQLVVSQAMNQFDTVTIIQVPRAENTNADALARLATGLEERLLKTVPIEILEVPSIDKPEQVGSIVVRPCWMDPIISFLRDGTLPADKFEARRLRFRSARYSLNKGKLYKKEFSSPSLLCLDEDRGKFTLEEVHAGVCGNHTSGRTLAHRILRQGYYWPTIQTDSLDFVRKCDKCQRFSAIPRQAPKDLTTVTSPWPFAKWGIDLIGPLPTAHGQLKYAVVAID